jgi:hypothetical protein
MLDRVPEVLIGRLLRNPQTLMDRVYAFPGSLPPYVSVAFPIPDNAQILASFVYDLNCTEVFIKVSQSLIDLEVFMLNKMRSDGWIVQRSSDFDLMRDSYPEPGFVQKPLISRISNEGCLIFLEPVRRATLVVDRVDFDNGLFSENEALVIRFYLNFDKHGSWQEILEEEAADPTNSIIMPILVPPSNTQVMPLSGWGNSIEQTYIVALRNTLNVQNLALHYEDQIQQAGWICFDHNKSDSFCWSLWKLEDTLRNQWKIFLYFFKENTSNTITGYFRVLNFTSSLKGFNRVFKVGDPGNGAFFQPQLALFLLEKLLKLDEYPQLTIGKAPESIYNKVPIPQESKIIGGFTVSREAHISFDAPLTPREVLDFYKENIKGYGWSRYPNLSDNQLGFESLGSIFNPIVFYNRDQNCELLLSMYPNYDVSSTSLSTVSISLQYDQKTSFFHEPNCTPRLAGQQSEKVPVPILDLPLDTHVFSRCEQTRPDCYDADVIVDTNLSSTSLFSHYELQMEKQGWSSQVRKEQALVCLSLWLKHDKNNQLWQSTLLFVSNEFNRNQFLVNLSVLKRDRPSP